jgi:ABC-type Fe3+/spermidine/putrescine transport system ATPase subunit
MRAPGPACLAFRPHAVRLDGAAAGNEDLGFDGTVAAATFQGDSVRYEVRVGQANVVAEQPHRRGARGWHDGAAVRLSIPAGELRLIAA